MTVLLRPDVVPVALTGLGVLPLALGLSLSASDTAGTNRLEAFLKVAALAWGLIIGIVYYGILLLVAIPGAVFILYQGLTDSELRGYQTVIDWITALSYWESDNYAYAFGDRDNPAWLPDTEQER